MRFHHRQQRQVEDAHRHHRQSAPAGRDRLCANHCTERRLPQLDHQRNPGAPARRHPASDNPLVGHAEQGTEGRDGQDPRTVRRPDDLRDERRSLLHGQRQGGRRMDGQEPWTARLGRHRRKHDHQEPQSQANQGAPDDRQGLQVQADHDGLAHHQGADGHLRSGRVPRTLALGLQQLLRVSRALRCYAKTDHGRTLFPADRRIPELGRADRENRHVQLSRPQGRLPRSTAKDLHRALRHADPRAAQDVRATAAGGLPADGRRRRGVHATGHHPHAPPAAGHVWAPDDG